jgi:hypothetical protein
MKIALATLATAASLAAFAVPASAARPEGQPDTSSATQASAGREDGSKTCRTFANSARRIGAKRVCLTREEWKKFDAEQAEG